MMEIWPVHWTASISIPTGLDFSPGSSRAQFESKTDSHFNIDFGDFGEGTMAQPAFSTLDPDDLERFTFNSRPAQTKLGNDAR